MSKTYVQFVLPLRTLGISVECKLWLDTNEYIVYVVLELIAHIH